MLYEIVYWNLSSIKFIRIIIDYYTPYKALE